MLKLASISAAAIRRDKRKSQNITPKVSSLLICSYITALSQYAQKADKKR